MCYVYTAEANMCVMCIQLRQICVLCVYNSIDDSIGMLHGYGSYSITQRYMCMLYSQ